MYLKPKRKVLSLIFFARTNIYQKQTCKFPLLFSLLIQIKWTNLKVTICALYLFLSYLALSANISAWISFSFSVGNEYSTAEKRMRMSIGMRMEMIRCATKRCRDETFDSSSFTAKLPHCRPNLIAKTKCTVCVSSIRTHVGCFF